MTASSLSMASRYHRLRRIPINLQRAATVQTTQHGSGSSSNHQHLVTNFFRRHKSSSSSSSSSLFANLAASLPTSLQESVKTSILDRVTRDDNKVWSYANNNNNGVNGKHDDKLNGDGINGTTNSGGVHCHHHQPHYRDANGSSSSSSHNNNHNNYNGQYSSELGSVNDEISAWHQDPLDDLYLKDERTTYWPHLPPSVRSTDDADPMMLTQNEVDSLSQSIREELLGTDHPVLNQAASYFFGAGDGGKKVRPLMVMLLSRALSDTVVASLAVADGSTQQQQQADAAAAVAAAESSSFAITSSSSSLFSHPLSWQRQDLPQAQRRLAEISEMIHTASLFHDDVIDGSETRRGVSSVHMVFGNKMAILAGDYLLARASISLARLRHIEVVECMSTIIEHLVRGEVMQMRGTATSEGSQNERMIYYLKKNYYKTGSLMANSCKSAALLAECPPPLVLASYKYGKHFGMAFQLVDDVLDFEGDAKFMGKPAFADLKAGLSTAPVLFAAEEYPELEVMMDRKFKEDGDLETARELVLKSQGIGRTKELARVHAERAMEAVLPWTDSVHRDALINLAYTVVRRTT